MQPALSNMLRSFRTSHDGLVCNQATISGMQCQWLCILQSSMVEMDCATCGTLIAGKLQVQPAMVWTNSMVAAQGSYVPDSDKVCCDKKTPRTVITPIQSHAMRDDAISHRHMLCGPHHQAWHALATRLCPQHISEEALFSKLYHN